MKRIEWHGLYSESWQGEIVPEAFAHPAKFSRALIRQIYRYLLDEQLIAPGAHIVDPFGGVGLGALDAMRLGLHWHGCELEPRFVELGNQNIGLWNARYSGWFSDWGTAVLHQGDSRQLAQVIGAAEACVSSPPYIDAVKSGEGPGAAGNEPQRARQVAGAPGENAYRNDGKYGSQSGQLGSMPSGDFDAAVSSPPYTDTIENGDGPGARFDQTGHPGNPAKISSAGKYGQSEGQLGAMDAAVSSPPFEAGTPTSQRPCKHTEEYKGKYGHIGSEKLNQHDYGDHPANIGNDTGDTFWSAARVIVEQLYQVLKPGAPAAFVCGDFVRKGKRVEFGQQWLDLCTAVGFVPYAWAIAWKTEYNGVQAGLFGNDKELRKDRVSFFRRLANEKNPDAAVLNEDVIILRR